MLVCRTNFSRVATSAPSAGFLPTPYLLLKLILLFGAKKPHDRGETSYKIVPGDSGVTFVPASLMFLLSLVLFVSAPSAVLPYALIFLPADFVMSVPPTLAPKTKQRGAIFLPSSLSFSSLFYSLYLSPLLSYTVLSFCYFLIQSFLLPLSLSYYTFIFA